MFFSSKKSYITFIWSEMVHVRKLLDDALMNLTPIFAAHLSVKSNYKNKTKNPIPLRNLNISYYGFCFNY